jgi:hypothetical protein
MTMAKAKAVYAQYGGSLYTSPEPVQIPPENAHVKEAPVALPAIISSLGKVLMSAMAPIVTEKITKEIGRHTDRPEVAEQISTALVEAAQKATGIEDPLEATVAAKTDPEAMQRVEQSILERLAGMAPLLQQLELADQQRHDADERSRAAAAARAPVSDWDMTPVLVIGALGLVAVLVLLVGCVLLHAPRLEN